MPTLARLDVKGETRMTAMIYPTTNPAMAEQMVVARGEGPYIFDKQGKQYLEGMAWLWCTALGYGN